MALVEEEELIFEENCNMAKLVTTEEQVGGPNSPKSAMLADISSSNEVDASTIGGTFMALQETTTTQSLGASVLGGKPIDKGLGEQDSRVNDGFRKRRIKSTDISHKEHQATRSGPSSVEWLRDIQKGDVSLFLQKTNV